MSADNGIYIAKFKAGWRVIEAQAIDNLSYYPGGSEGEKEIWRDYFGNAPLIPTLQEARNAAFEMASKCDMLEYGISDLGDGVEFE